MSEMHDPYEDQLAAARYRAERDQARQECERLRNRLRDSVPRKAYERRRAAWLRHIRECETALHRRRELIKKLENAALDRRTVRAEDREAAEWVRDHGGLDAVEQRLMPEVMEWLAEAWPRFEDDAPVRMCDEADKNGENFGISMTKRTKTARTSASAP